MSETAQTDKLLANMPLRYVAQVRCDSRVNVREEPSTASRVEAQLFDGTVLSVVTEPEGPSALVGVLFFGYVTETVLKELGRGQARIPEWLSRYLVTP